MIVGEADTRKEQGSHDVAPGRWSGDDRRRKDTGESGDAPATRNRVGVRGAMIRMIEHSAAEHRLANQRGRQAGGQAGRPRTEGNARHCSVASLGTVDVKVRISVRASSGTSSWYAHTVEGSMEGTETLATIA